jgi:periplasmic divalent cation tolerance protein
MTDKIVVLSTCGSAKEAAKIARALVEKKLAACVSVMPEVRSVYRWKDAIEEEQESLLVIKSSRGLFNQLRAEIEKLHSYEVPEIIAVPIVDGSEGYLEWLNRELAAKQEP